MPYVNEKNLTDVVLDRWKNIPDPRLKQVMQSLIKHLHAFVRDIEPTEAEWATAIDFLARIGKKCDDKRQEFILFSDVMGVSMLVDAINHRLDSGATPTTVEGPFHVPDAPAVANGGDMAKGAPGIPCFVSGRVRGRPAPPVLRRRRGARPPPPADRRRDAGSVADRRRGPLRGAARRHRAV